MPNRNGRAYGLSCLFPLRNDAEGHQSFSAIVRGMLRRLPLHEESPLAKVPNTYLCRLFVLDDVFYQGKPAQEEHLKSKYLVMIVELHGELDPWLRDLWSHAHATVTELFKYCVAFRDVDSADEWVRYVKRCQVETTFYFMGSTDAPLAEQLKALYLKQELAHFALENQGKDAASLQRAFSEFVTRVRPQDLQGPTWRPGASTLDDAVLGGEA